MFGKSLSIRFSRSPQLEAREDWGQAVSVVVVEVEDEVGRFR